MIFLVHFNKERKLWPAVLSLVTVVLVMISRMYLGGHSLDQVLFGFIVAIVIVLVYEFGGARHSISRLLLSFGKKDAKLKVGLVLLSCYCLAFYVYSLNSNMGP